MINMRQQLIAFKGQKITLEGIISTPNSISGPFPGVVLCHPHPLFGESMDSHLMQSLSRMLASEGISTLRFNFRGVGGSDGTFDRGVGEQEDLKAAINTFKQWPGIKKNRIAVAGVSFGATVILDVLPKPNEVQALALVSPTASALQRSKLDKFGKSKQIIVGDKDRLVPSGQLHDILSTMKSPVQYTVIAGADHTWSGYEDQLASQLTQFLTNALT